VLGKGVHDRRLQIAFLSAGGFALVVGLYQGVIINYTSERTPALKVAYLFEAMWEAAFFGFGLGFFVVYGFALRGIDSGPVKKRCIAIWLAISYFYYIMVASCFSSSISHTNQTNRLHHPRSMLSLAQSFCRSGSLLLSIGCSYHIIRSSSKQQRVTRMDRSWYHTRALVQKFKITCSNHFNSSRRWMDCI